MRKSLAFITLLFLFLTDCIVASAHQIEDQTDTISGGGGPSTWLITIGIMSMVLLAFGLAYQWFNK
jgi:hypothetical protein